MVVEAMGEDSVVVKDVSEDSTVALPILDVAEVMIKEKQKDSLVGIDQKDSVQEVDDFCPLHEPGPQKPNDDVCALSLSELFFDDWAMKRMGHSMPNQHKKYLTLTDLDETWFLHRVC